MITFEQFYGAITPLGESLHLALLTHTSRYCTFSYSQKLKVLTNLEAGIMQSLNRDESLHCILTSMRALKLIEGVSECHEDVVGDFSAAVEP